MKLLFPIGFVGLSCLLFSAQVLAQTDDAPAPPQQELSESPTLGSTPAAENTSPLMDKAESKSPWLFIGMDGGWARLTGTTMPEANKSGYQFSIKALGSFYSRHWVLDTGLGYFTNNISDNEAGQEIRIITNGAFVEVSPRYRLGPSWQLGPVINALFSSDATFSPNPDDSNPISGLIGLRIQREMDVHHYTVRAGLQGLTDFTISDRQIWLIEGDLQFGFSLY
jgi:hypothetical protein